jgi:hypothetical protein
MQHERQRVRLLLRIFLLLNLFLLVNACVSVNVRPAPTKHAENLQITEPESPFEKQSNNSADDVWQSQATGNTIAVISECKPATETALAALENDTINAMTDAEILSTSHFTYNDREAIQTTAHGLMDGVAVKMRVVTFKKNSCNFILTYVGRATVFSREESIFDHFLKGFKVP